MDLINIRDWQYTPNGNEDFAHNLQHEQLSVLNAPLTINEIEIQKFYQDEGCQTALDLGCWTGVESFRTFANFNPSKLVMVDAVPLFLNNAKSLFESSSFNLDNIFVKDLCILNNDDKASFKDYILVDEKSSYSIAGIGTSARSPKIEDPVILSVGELATPSEAADNITSLNLENCFYKSTLMGADLALLSALLERRFHPNVIWLELKLKNESVALKLVNILGRLRDVGYRIPWYMDILQTNSTKVNLLVSKNHMYIFHDYKMQGQKLVSTPHKTY